VIGWINAIPGSTVFISVVTQAEILYAEAPVSATIGWAEDGFKHFKALPLDRGSSRLTSRRATVFRSANVRPLPQVERG
jgi:hypothetical protein